MRPVAILSEGCDPMAEAIAASLVGLGHAVVVPATSGGPEPGDDGVIRRMWNSEDGADCRRIVKTIEADVGPVRILVNNASASPPVPFEQLGAAEWKAALRSELTAVFNLCNAVWPFMLSRSFGRIVNFSSVLAQTGAPGHVAHCAARSGIHGFTKSLAQEGAPEGITVNTLAVGNLTSREASAVARAVLFLCDERAGYITGSTVSINGGAHMY